MSQAETKNSESKIILENVPELSIKCSICPTLFSSANDRRIHLINIHQETGPLAMNLIEIVTNYYDKDILECPPCSMTFASKLEFLNHLSTIHSDPGTRKNFKCDHCTSRFSKLGGLRRHLSKAHQDKIQPAKPDNFLNKEDENSRECSHCHLKFLKRTYLMTHLREVHLNCASMDYKCEKCPYQTGTKNNLTRHILRSHTKKKIKDAKKHADSTMSNTTECSICHLKFFKRRFLLIHEKEVHLDKNNIKYKCKNCSFETSYRDSLRRHVSRQHNPASKVSKDDSAINKKGQFECKECKKSFSCNLYLTRHLKSSHGIESKKTTELKCDVCAITISGNYNLRRHLKSISHLDKVKAMTKSTNKKQIQNIDNAPSVSNSLTIRLREQLESVKISNSETLKLTQILNEAFGALASLENPKERLNLAHSLQQGLFAS